MVYGLYLNKAVVKENFRSLNKRKLGRQGRKPRELMTGFRVLYGERADKGDWSFQLLIHFTAERWKPGGPVGRARKEGSQMDISKWNHTLKVSSNF